MITRHNSKINCYGCKFLGIQTDGTGGRVYICKKNNGLVLAEWGHWSPDIEEPKPVNDCYEGDSR